MTTSADVVRAGTEEDQRRPRITRGEIVLLVFDVCIAIPTLFGLWVLKPWQGLT